jgi:cytochrome o ubiquinol oxidase subunit II
VTGVLDPQGPVAAAERLILINSTAIMLVVVLPVIALTLGFAWWYRSSNRRATYDPDWSYSGQIEMVIWSIPAMVVILLGAVSWTGSHQLDPAVKLASNVKPVRIEALSLDWQWLFIYPDEHVAAVNQLVVPAGAPIEFTLSSATVMNAFFVPQLGSQIYTMPGMSTRLNLLADRAGDYPGFSSHFSGDGFADMHFMVHAVTPGDYADWLTQTRAAGDTLDKAAYATLAAPQRNRGAKTYRDVEPHLYEWVVQGTTQMPGADGPATGDTRSPGAQGSAPLAADARPAAAQEP